MPSIANIPVSGVKLSCMAFTEPFDVTVVVMPQYAEAAEPNRTSFPSILPRWLTDAHLCNRRIAFHFKINGRNAVNQKTYGHHTKYYPGKSFSFQHIT